MGVRPHNGIVKPVREAGNVSEHIAIRVTSVDTSLPPDETVTWKHRCSEFFLLAHVMQLIKPDKMH